MVSNLNNALSKTKINFDFAQVENLIWKISKEFPSF